MRVFCLLFLLGLCLASSHGSSDNQRRTLRPFVTDGCSALFGNTRKAWTSCCVDHDFAYWIGGTQNQKRIADDRLGACFKSTGYAGLLPAGAWNTPLAKRQSQERWGVGWTPRTADAPLTEGEWASVERNQEIFSLRQPIVSNTNPKPCNPEIQERMATLSALKAKENLTCFTLAFSGLGVTEWLVFSPECSGFYILQFKIFSPEPSLYGYGECDVSAQALANPQRPVTPRCPWSEGNLLSIYHLQKKVLASVR